ncbi:hypothetical protein COU78_06680 [Candidatus Peregrinibacteria bacterium CG10_big_fil_rev_8_21_14_0_10_49_24]|nr:MAG: hypothetical protein COV83_01975 [Candidatus Peregrinibacteria bacterium CG11_big_fil_rev_8_21_14_0_20_49_14]PIR50376.1 MAG: hypothetical protein COU78_06680 [Candidatus Peregrinibacteria bacterium CG10_big_fil_rev_8_21_14_0_10_49_24]PJA67465.1 MAG: hypothetical protein CO157_03470 [Candidatus Peregrinibacteria bacterium CG_4_9_14_3_um_filter_49_12]
MPNPQNDTSPRRHIDPALLAVMPTGTDVHDALMGPIEEDLLTGNLPTLSTKYMSETAQERAQRIERYKAALRKYDKAYAEWVSAVNAKVDGYKTTVLSYVQEKSANEDEGEISRLETEFSDPQNS